MYLYINSFCNFFVVVADFKLFFYQFFGDAAPRLIAPIKDATAVINKSLPNTVQIVMADRRKWALEFTSSFDACKLCFAIHESKKILENGNSLFMKESALPPIFSRII